MPAFLREPPQPSMKMDGGLNVHLRTDSHQSALVVFVHGLNGSGYGTWGDMPGAVFASDRFKVDVALFDYVSGLRRRFGFSPNLPDVARELNSQLDSLQYGHIILVGHSMGGIVSSMALRFSHQKTPYGRSDALVHRASSLIALASPRSGSRAVIFGGQKDARLLRIHNAEVTENAEFFTNHVDTRWRGDGRAAYRIPIWAATATDDRYVDYFTATFGVPGDQVDTFSGTHTSFLHQADTRDWLIERIGRSMDKKEGAPDAGTGAIRTRFRGDPLHSGWHDSFHRAIRRFGSARHGVAIYDATHEPRDGGETHLQVRVVSADRCASIEVRKEIWDYCQEMEEGKLFALGVAPFGGEVSEAAQVVARLVEDRPAAWVSPTPGPEVLEDEILQWLVRTKESLTHANRLRGYQWQPPMGV